MFLFTFLLPSLMLSLPLSPNDPIYLISTRDPSALTSHLASLQSALNSQIEITNIYSNLAIHQDLPSLPHYAARLSPDALAYLRQHLSHEIAYIEQDQIYSIIKETTTAEPAPPSQDQCITQENPEWGLSRINQRGEFEYGTYAYDTRYAGAGVNIYIVGMLYICQSSSMIFNLDTGIYCENDDFVEKVAGTCTYGIDVIGNLFTL